MPDLASLQLCLTQLAPSPVSTPTPRSEGSPASMSGSGVSMTHKSRVSSGRPFLDWSPSLDARPASAGLHSRVESQSALFPLEDDDDQQPASPRLPQRMDELREEHKESNDPQQDQLSASRRASRLSVMEAVSSPSWSRSSQPSSSFSSSSPTRQRLFNTLVASRELREGYLAIQRMRRNRRKQAAAPSPVLAGSHLRVLRSLTRHTQAAASQQLVQQRIDSRHRYQRVLQSSAASSAHEQPLASYDLYVIQPRAVLPPIVIEEESKEQLRPAELSLASLLSPAALRSPEAAKSPLSVKGRLLQLMVDKAHQEKGEELQEAERVRLLHQAGERAAETEEPRQEAQGGERREAEQQRGRQRDAEARALQEELERRIKEVARAQQRRADEDVQKEAAANRSMQAARRAEQQLLASQEAAVPASEAAAAELEAEQCVLSDAAEQGASRPAAEALQPVEGGSGAESAAEPEPSSAQPAQAGEEYAEGAGVRPEETLPAELTAANAAGLTAQTPSAGSASAEQETGSFVDEALVEAVQERKAEQRRITEESVHRAAAAAPHPAAGAHSVRVSAQPPEPASKEHEQKSPQSVASSTHRLLTPQTPSETAAEAQHTPTTDCPVQHSSPSPAAADRSSQPASPAAPVKEPAVAQVSSVNASAAPAASDERSSLISQPGGASIHRDAAHGSASRPPSVHRQSLPVNESSRASSLSIPKSSPLLGSKSPITRSPNSIVSRSIASAANIAALPELRLDEGAAKPAPPVLQQQPPPSWITDADRDGLFDYLADEADLFSTDVKLSNASLNELLTAGGSLAHTLALCRLIDSKAIQVETIDQLTAQIVEQAAAAPPARAPPGRAPAPALSAGWISAGDRDGLFEFLARDERSLFTANAKLSNRALDALLQEGGSLPNAIARLNELEADHRTFATVDELLKGMQEGKPPAPVERPVEQLPLVHEPVAAPKQDAPAPRPSSFSFQRPSGPTTPAPPSASSTSPSLPGAHFNTQWITDRDRDALHAYLTAPNTQLFTHPTPIAPGLLTSMLAMTGSVYTCIEALSSLQKSHAPFPHPTPLLVALQHEIAHLYPAASDRPSSPHTSNRASRDALFGYLSSAYCHLFSASVKLNNFTLDHLLYQGRGLQCTLAACHHLDEQGKQYSNADSLTLAVSSIIARQPAEELQLLQLLSHPQHQKSLFTSPLAITPSDVSKLWVSGQASDETLAYVLLIEEDVLMRGKDKLQSFDELRHEVQRRHAATRLERRKEMERVYEFMHQPMRRVVKRGTIVSMEECGRLVMGGREDLRADRPCQTIAILGGLEAAHEECGSVEELIKRVSDKRKGILVALGEKPILPTAPLPVQLAKKLPLPPTPLSPVSPPVPSTSTPQLNPSAPWITSKERDALFDYLASDECALFSTNVKLNNKALDSLLIAGTSLPLTLSMLASLNSQSLQFRSVDALRQAMHSPPITDSDRDRIFHVLADDTQLFTVDVKLTNKALDSIIRATGGRDKCEVLLKKLHGRQEQFDSIPALLTALEAAINNPHADHVKDRDTLWTLIQTANLFTTDTLISDHDLDHLIHAMTLDRLMVTIDKMSRYHIHYTSCGQLISAMLAIKEIPCVEAVAMSGEYSGADRDVLFEYLASDTCNVFVSNVKLTNKALDRVLASGRGVEGTVSILKVLGTRMLQVDGAARLCEVLDQEYRHARDALVECMAWFMSAGCPVQVKPSPADLLKFYWTAETGPELIHHLTLIPPSPSHTLSTLSPLISASRLTHREQVHEEVERLHSVMGGKVRGKGQGVRGVLGRVEGLSVYECWMLAKAGRVGLSASESGKYLERLVQEKKGFGSVEELCESIRAMCEAEHAQDKGSPGVVPRRV